jgi:hypothetical protein
MFNQSYEQLSLRKQIIACNQAYPCPRCQSGTLKSFGYTETLKCSQCERNFVPLFGARLLYPALRMATKIAPVYWWDGVRWHWAGTTASFKQVVCIFILAIMPFVLLHGAILADIWKTRPEWCSPLLMSVLVGLITMQMIYLICWDFEFPIGKKSNHQSL